MRWQTSFEIHFGIYNFRCQHLNARPGTDPEIFQRGGVRRKVWVEWTIKKQKHYMFIHVISVYTHKNQTKRSVIFLFLSVYFSFFCFSILIFNFQNSKGGCNHRTPSVSANTGDVDFYEMVLIAWNHYSFQVHKICNGVKYCVFDSIAS